MYGKLICEKLISQFKLVLERCTRASLPFELFVVSGVLLPWIVNCVTFERILLAGLVQAWVEFGTLLL